LVALVEGPLHKMIQILVSVGLVAIYVIV
jgi:hypothetical protein